jgi:hypothetical protein
MNVHLEDDGVSLLSGRDSDLLGELVYRLELRVHLLRGIISEGEGQSACELARRCRRRRNEAERERGPRLDRYANVG